MQSARHEYKLFAGHLHRHTRLAEGVSCGKGVILGGGVTLDWGGGGGT